jgi:quercetin dioxygenase-like cupin family protein
MTAGPYGSQLPEATTMLPSEHGCDISARMTAPASPRRVVTGHAADGRSVFLADGPAPVRHDVSERTAFFEIWSTDAAPAPIAAVEDDEPAQRPLAVPPPPRGTNVRVIVQQPGEVTPMHRTQTIDYGVVLEGAVWLVLDDSETELHAGDEVVQRGTEHRWENRGSVPARVVFVCVDGAFTASLREALPPEALDRLMTDPRS